MIFFFSPKRRRDERFQPQKRHRRHVSATAPRVTARSTCPLPGLCPHPAAPQSSSGNAPNSGSAQSSAAPALSTPHLRSTAEKPKAALPRELRVPEKLQNPPRDGRFFLVGTGDLGRGMLRRVAGAGGDRQGQDGNCLACPSQRYPVENHHPKETPQIPNAPFHPGKAFGVSRSWDFPLPTQTSRAFVHPPSTLSSLQAISPSPKAKRPPETSGNVPTGSGHSGDAPVTAPASRKLPGTAGTGRSRGHPSARATPTSTRCPLQGCGTPSLVSPWRRCPLLTPGIVSAPPRHGVFLGGKRGFSIFEDGKEQSRSPRRPWRIES